MISLTVSKKRLNDDDINLLKKIFEYGGYATCPSINNYRTDRNQCNNRRFLYRMVENGYLKANPFYSDSYRDVIVYQVTAKTCKLFGNPDSYYRKKHSEQYIIRTLIKQHFIFEISKSFDNNILSLHEDRLDVLTKNIGFDMALLPKKRDDNTLSTHVEEYIIDVRGLEQGNLACSKTGEVLFDFKTSPRGIIIVYIDRSEVNYYTQLMNLYQRYKAMLDKELVKMDFIIVVDSEERQASYIKSIDRCFKVSLKKPMEIHDSYIKLHMKILQETLNIPYAKIKDMPEKIKQKYSELQELLDEDYEGIPIKEIRLNGIKALEKAVLGIIQSSPDIYSKTGGISEFFKKIYKLYTAGKLTRGTDFEMKVYSIGHKFSL